MSSNTPTGKRKAGKVFRPWTALFTAIVVGTLAGALYGGLVGALRLLSHGRWERVPSFVLLTTAAGAATGLVFGVAGIFLAGGRNRLPGRGRRRRVGF
jgi:hypothetical protein